jgi:hypothetical protein
MVNKRRHACRRGMQKSAKRATLPEVVASAAVCPKCNFHAIDSYDLSFHLRGNAYCNETNNTSINSASLPHDSTSSDVFLPYASLPANDGDDFMFDDECGDVDQSLFLDDDMIDDGKLPPPKKCQSWC